MEFTFDVNEILKHEITKITPSLIPPGFTGDRRKLWDTQTKLGNIINMMGEASAPAQGLTKSITTADKLKNSDHTLYLLVDPKGTKGKGAVMGLLKMGHKGLYVFDRDGQHHQLQPLCVLDFYVHETMQRMGLGKKIFEHMLKEENIEPIKLAIDRPSEKFLGFLKKHYGLTGAIPQMNNFVVFDGFFPKVKAAAGTPEHQHNNNSHSTNVTPTKSQNGCQSTSPFGRYGAPRPPCSMGQIIHNHSPTVQPAEPTSDHPSSPVLPPTTPPPPPPPASSQPPLPVHHHSPKLERPRSLSLHTADDPAPKEEDNNKQQQQQQQQQQAQNNEHHHHHHQHADDDDAAADDDLQTRLDLIDKETATLVLNTEPRVKIAERENNIIPAEIPAEYTPRTPSNLTEQGFLDLKFYHSRLW